MLTGMAQGGVSAPTRADTKVLVRCSQMFTGIVALYYAILIGNGTIDFGSPDPLGLLFNDMAWHLLRFDFTISPDVVREEAFVRDGVTYTYFGIFPAVLRVPFILFGRPDLPLSKLSCWLALSMSAMLQTSIVLRICTTLPVSRLRVGLVLTGLAALLLTGPQLGLTFTAWVYNEPILWGGVFVLLFIRTAVFCTTSGTQPDAKGWLRMGLFCGAALNTRPTDAVAIAVGITAAVLVFSVPLVWGSRRATAYAEWIGDALRASVLCGCAFLPLGAIAFFVNWNRWGNPFEFMPEAYAVQFLADPRRMRVLNEVGSFNFVHIPLAASYYLLGMPRYPGMAETLDRLFDSAGYPRSILMLTSTTAIGLTVYGVGAWARSCYNSRAVRQIGFVAAIVAGLTSVGQLLLLSYLNYRYRYAFVPLLTVGVSLGVVAFSSATLSWQRHIQHVLLALLAINILVSHLDLLQAKLASFALPETARNGVVRETWPIPKLFGIELPKDLPPK